MSVENKVAALKRVLTDMERVIVAYSGGVDSALLLKIAHDCLGENAIGVTAVSASLAAHEKQDAEDVASWIGARLVFLDSHETEDPRYISNMPNRCYFCKSDVYQELNKFARQQGFKYVVDGTNADDAHDHRPGRIAAKENNIRSPLLEISFTKAEIRQAAKEMGLPNWDKPSAACLSSRIPYGTAITLDILSQVEKAELTLLKMGFGQSRVRHHGPIARIEVEPSEFERVLKNREEIIKSLINIGFTYITLDLSGFRSGSMNEKIANYGY